MASTTETGHPMIVANFEDLINFCLGYGAAYNPSRESIKIASLTNKLTNAQASLQAVKVAKADYDNATNQREEAFSTLKKFSTRIINALAATDATELTLDDARTSINKIQGKRATKKAAVVSGDVETKVTTISTSQQSYDSLINHFATLIATVSSEPTYTPNEPELTPTGLNTTLLDLRTKNTATLITATALSNARIARDKSLHAENTGLIDTALAVKNYVKSVFGSSSPEFKQVSRIKFS